VGRYPIANGQVYAGKGDYPPNAVLPPVYLYPAGSDLYEEHNQMPLEECGDMIIMLAAAAKFTGKTSLAARHRHLLDRWARYLLEKGEDPGEQLCTDDFAGHLSRNVNLAAKALVAVACYGQLLAAWGENGTAWERKARALAESWQARAKTPEATALTFDGAGWSQKYNLAWDRVLGLGLLPEEFYRREVGGYLLRLRPYGLPLDSRAGYTKSDWTAWCAAMAPDRGACAALLAPLAKFLRETPDRVPFSDWYDTDTGKHQHFMARSVQGGLWMPLLRNWGR
jgi:hypothetical protein